MYAQGIVAPTHHDLNAEHAAEGQGGAALGGASETRRAPEAPRAAAEPGAEPEPERGARHAMLWRGGRGEPHVTSGQHQS